jgi:hypothetical protein
MKDMPDAAAKPLHAYLDTNALLEFRPPRDLDWNGLLREKQLVLVVSPVVIEELQRIKDGALRDIPRRKRLRAGETLKTLERELFPDDAQPAGVVRLNDGVGLRFDGRAVPSAVFTDNSLDPNLADARLVAAVIAARDAGQRVCLVGNDAGPRWQAKSRGIAAHNLPETWRVQEEPDAVETELRDVKKRLAAFESRAPKVCLVTKTGDTFLRRELPKPRLPLEEQVNGYMELVRLMYPHYGKDALGRFGYRNVLAPPARGEVERYNKRIDTFQEKAQEVLPKLIAFRNELDLYVSLDGIAIANEGTQPAEHVELVLRPPPGATFAIERPIDDRPRFPEPPEQPQSVFDTIGAASAMAALSHVSPLLYAGAFNAEPLSLAPEWEMNGGEASIAIATLRHRSSESLPPIWVKLASYEEATGFSVAYEISAYNVPHPVTGSLNVPIIKSSQMRELDLDRWNDDDFEEDERDTPDAPNE